MKIQPACEIMVLFTYWHKPALIVHADTVESTVFILVYRSIKKVISLGNISKVFFTILLYINGLCFLRYMQLNSHPIYFF